MVPSTGPTVFHQYHQQPQVVPGYQHGPWNPVYASNHGPIPDYTPVYSMPVPMTPMPPAMAPIPMPMFR